MSCFNFSNHGYFNYSVIDGKYIQFDLNDENTFESIKNEPEFLVRELIDCHNHKDEFMVNHNLLNHYNERKLPISLINQMSLEEFDLIVHYCTIYLDFAFFMEELIKYSNYVLLNKNKWRSELLNKIEREKKTAEIKKRRSQFQKNRDKLMLLIIKRDGYFCQFCKTTEDLEVDHIRPLSKGGSDELDNLQLLCGSCNNCKGARY